MPNSIDEIISLIKSSLQGEHKKHKYICEIILKHHVHGRFYKTKESESMNDWLWLAKYNNSLVEDGFVQGNGKTAEDALIDLFYQLESLGIIATQKM